jgi:phage shock protein C
MQYPPNDVTFHTTQTEQLQERNDKWRKLGLVLMGVGGLVLLNHLGIGMSVIIPPLMIIAGVVLLKRSQ